MLWFPVWYYCPFKLPSSVNGLKGFIWSCSFINLFKCISQTKQVSCFKNVKVWEQAWKYSAKYSRPEFSGERKWGRVKAADNTVTCCPYRPNQFSVREREACEHSLLQDMMEIRQRSALCSSRAVFAVGNSKDYSANRTSPPLRTCFGTRLF